MLGGINELDSAWPPKGDLDSLLFKVEGDGGAGPTILDSLRAIIILDVAALRRVTTGAGSHDRPETYRNDERGL